MKKLTVLLLTGTMILSLTACGSSATSTSTASTASEATSEAASTAETSEAAADISDYAGSTVMGMVTAVDGSSVTLNVFDMGGDMPQGGQGQGGQAPSGSDIPEMPEGSEVPSGSDIPEMPQGSGSDIPEMPQGGKGQGGQAPSGSEIPEMPQGSGSDIPEMPEGSEVPSGSDVPEMPQGGGFGGTELTVDLSGATIQTMGEDGTAEEASLEDITENTMLQLEVAEDGTITTVTISDFSGGQGKGSFNNSGEVDQGSAAVTISEDSEIADESYASTGDDENALRIDGAEVTLDGITVDKSEGSSSDVESGDFYGMNAALLATNGATVTITDAEVNSSAQNGNGIFSYGEGTTVNVSDTEITTTADNSGGIQTTGGATTNAENLTVETNGASSAAIRSDRGGGTVNVKKGTYTSNGLNSPAVYSTADITVKKATLTANNSEALVIEGQNSITLKDCDVTGNMSDTEGSSSSENVHNVMIYQSMSGDAEVGQSVFSMTGGSLISENGDMFYITNTDCELDLEDVEVENEDEDANLMTISGNSASKGWGTAGANGATVTCNCSDQELEGSIVVDSISSLDLTLSDESILTGTINIIDNEEGGTSEDAAVSVTIDKGSKWNLTGDCTVTELTNNGTINYNGYTITLADGTVLEG